MVLSSVGEAQKPPPPEPPFLAGCFFTSIYQLSGALHRDFVQTNVLDGGPDNDQTTGLCREHINLIGALAHIAEEAFNGIGRLNMPVHGLRKGIKGQEVLFILRQASHCFPDSAEYTWL